MFRVAAHISRPQLQKYLEDVALSYMGSKTVDTLAELEYAVRLTQEVGEISSVNAGVLLREINGLKKTLSDMVYEKAETVAKGSKERILIEEMFSKPPMIFSEFAKMIAHISEEKDEEVKTKAQKSGNEKMINSGVKSIDIDASQKSPATYIKEDKKSGNENIEKDGINTAKITETQKSPAISMAKSVDEIPKAAYFSERQEMIVDLLKKRTLCHIKDIQDILPGISDRTLRYDIQRLVDKKIIERVGTGGPKSFLRIKKQKTA